LAADVSGCSRDKNPFHADPSSDLSTYFPLFQIIQALTKTLTRKHPHINLPHHTQINDDPFAAVLQTAVFMTRQISLLIACLLCASAVYAQQSQTPEPISDNSFLIEEAYNQAPGVVQHINTFTRSRGGDWLYTFTQEWPIGSMKHQFSYTFAALSLNRAEGIGDLAINYRYQLANGARVSVAPRVSLLVPIGDWRRGLGAGGLGFQTNLPISVTVSKKIVTHWNAGATFVPRAKDVLDEKAFTKGVNLGQSTIWLAHPRFNVMMETAWNRFESVIGRGRLASGYTLLLNPGVRWAYNFKSGLQIVPGVSFPIGVGPSLGSRSVFLYLSFEHPFKKIQK
jgi:hypothetical protein